MKLPSGLIISESGWILYPSVAVGDRIWTINDVRRMSKSSIGTVINLSGGWINVRMLNGKSKHTNHYKILTLTEEQYKEAEFYLNLTA